MKRILFLCLSLFLSVTFGITAQQLENVTAIIHKDITNDELNDLKGFFKEHDIDLIIHKIDYNEDDEVTGLSLTLKHKGSKSRFSSFSSFPIDKVELGYKKNSLFITSKDVAETDEQGVYYEVSKLLQSSSSNFNLDSLDLNSIGNSINNLMKQWQNSNFTTINKGDESTFSFDWDIEELLNFAQHHLSHFLNNPDLYKEVFVLINGKESNLDALEQYDTEDILDVDFVFPKEAIIKYGDRAKYGAIIIKAKE